MNVAISDQPITLIALGGLCLSFMTVLVIYLHHVAKKQHIAQRSVIDLINNLLPQTQCGQCGFEGCRPYARAITQGEAINRCPPGGNETIIKLANLLNEQPEPLNPANGKITPFSVAIIREDECIGCTKCIKACPVDAIVGAAKLMHTVIIDQCTGCDLCVEPCPVDCIDMIPVQNHNARQWSLPTKILNPLASLERIQ